ncbi:hypothetical protein ACLOJK_039121 [Asimina triloba]
MEVRLLLWGAADGWNEAWVSAGRWLVVWPWEKRTVKMGLIGAVRTALMATTAVELELDRR